MDFASSHESGDGLESQLLLNKNKSTSTTLAASVGSAVARSLSLLDRIRKKDKFIFKLIKKRRHTDDSCSSSSKNNAVSGSNQPETMRQSAFSSILNLPKKLHLEEADASIDNNASQRSHEDYFDEFFYQMEIEGLDGNKQIASGLINGKRKVSGCRKGSIGGAASVKTSKKSKKSKRHHGHHASECVSEAEEIPAADRQGCLGFPSIEDAEIEMLRCLGVHLGGSGERGVADTQAGGVGTEPAKKESHNQNSYSRREKSLEELSKKFLTIFLEKDSMMISLDKITQQLDVERRRIYDIINILESLKLVTRRGKNNYKWNGFQSIFATIEMFQNVSQDEAVAAAADAQDDPSVAAAVDLANEKKEKSLEILSIGFLKLFLNDKETLSLEEAAKKLSPSNCENQKIKTKIRRLYDIANVFKSLGLIRKVQQIETKKPAFQWVGISGLQEFQNTTMQIEATEIAEGNKVEEDAISQAEEDDCIKNEDDCEEADQDLQISVKEEQDKDENNRSTQAETTCTQMATPIKQLNTLLLEEAVSSLLSPSISFPISSFHLLMGGEHVDGNNDSKAIKAAGALGSSKNSAFKRVDKSIIISSNCKQLDDVKCTNQFVIPSPSSQCKQAPMNQDCAIMLSPFNEGSPAADIKKNLQLLNSFNSKNSAFNRANNKQKHHPALSQTSDSIEERRESVHCTTPVKGELNEDDEEEDEVTCAGAAAAAVFDVKQENNNNEKNEGTQVKLETSTLELFQTPVKGMVKHEQQQGETPEIGFYTPYQEAMYRRKMRNATHEELVSTSGSSNQSSDSKNSHELNQRGFTDLVSTMIQMAAHEQKALSYQMSLFEMME